MGRLFHTSRHNDGLSVTSLADTQPPSSGTARRRVLTRLATSLLIVAVAATFLAGVATNGLPCLSNCGATTAPVRGGSIVDGIQFDTDSLLPLRTGLNWSLMVDQAIWAPLWYGDPQGVFHAGLAAEVPSSTNGDISPDLTTWTIHLRAGLKWSDGSPLTAEDCAFSFNLYANPAYTVDDGSPTGFPTTDPADPIGFESATALDTTTVVLKLKHPYVTMSAMLADGVGTCLPRKVFAGMTACRCRPVVTELLADRREWPLHRQGACRGRPPDGGAQPLLLPGTRPTVPRSDHVQGLQRAPDPLTPLRTHTMDTAWYLTDYTQLANYQAIPGYTTYLDRNPDGYEWLIFNMNDPLMSDHAIRQAITMGFDVNEIPAFLNGAAKLTCDDSAGTFAHEPSLVPCYQYDPTKAGQTPRRRWLGHGRGRRAAQEWAAARDCSSRRPPGMARRDRRP